ncbi:MAG: fibronectin type III domain-containing protein [Promethearchaeota archaeon]
MTKFSYSAYFYTAELIDLQPNKTYFYRVSSDNNNVREIMNFTTLANKTDHVRFLVYGDSRTQRNVRSVLASKIMENFNDSFDFSILLGDIVEFGSLQDQWNEYFSDTEVLNAYKQGIYVEGNH